MNTQKNQKGFTLIELIVVVAIMGIIGAALVPQFSTMALRSRMTTDLSTIKTAQNQVDIYYQDLGVWPGDNYSDVIETLVTASYLDSRYLDTNGSSLLIQTDSGSVGFDDTNHKLFLSVTDEDFDKYNKQADKDQEWLRSS